MFYRSVQMILKKIFGLDYIQSMGKSFPPSLRVNKSLCLVDVKLYMGAPVAAFPNRKNGISDFSPRNSICYSQPCKFHHMGS